MKRIIQFRQDLHRIPETGLDLPETQKYIEDVLHNLNCQVLNPVHSAVCAWFDFGKDDAIAFRSDMDALPLQETTGLPFSSCHPHAAHSCGHDAHMSILLEFACRLSALPDCEKERIPHNILLVFQPGEESPGGAAPVIETGIFDQFNVKKIFGIHMWPLVPAGKIATRPGAMMARSSEINVEFSGKGAHAGRAYEGIDALQAACDFVMRIQKLNEKLSEEGKLHVLHFGKMNAGKVRNAVADYARIEGTVRVFSDEDFDAIQSSIHNSLKEIEEKYGVKTAVSFSTGYPALINDEKLTEELLAEFPEILQLEKPEMISEDFSYYLREMPGTFFYLGSGRNFELHDPAFDIDENVLENGPDFYMELAKRM